jgi:hypothetical protein
MHSPGSLKQTNKQTNENQKSSTGYFIGYFSVCFKKCALTSSKCHTPYAKCQGWTYQEDKILPLRSSPDLGKTAVKADNHNRRLSAMIGCLKRIQQE